MHEDPLSGHFGYNGTYQRIAIKYWWNGMGTDIKDFVKSCPVCQFTGSRKFKEPLHPIKVGQPFDHIVIDLNWTKQNYSTTTIDILLQQLIILLNGLKLKQYQQKKLLKLQNLYLKK